MSTVQSRDRDARAAPGRLDPARVLRYLGASPRRRRLLHAALRAAAPAVPPRAPASRPIFVVGAPRSGTSMVFEVLDRSPSLRSLHGESHVLWELYHPPSGPGWRSHALAPSDVRPHEAKVLSWLVDLVAGGRRYLDKSPRNSLRIPYLHALFPTACFVFVRRDGRAAVSSLLTGWRSGDPLFPGTRLPAPLDIEGYAGTRWRYLVPPGWEAYRTSSLAEVCAFQWVAANDAVVSARRDIPGDRWVDVEYERFVAEPQAAAAELLERLGLPRERQVLHHAARLDQHVTRAVTPPRPDKWREENPEDVERVLPLISRMMERLGYDAVA